MTHSSIESLYCDGYHFFIRGWILYQGIPSWEFSKKIILSSDTNKIQIVPDLDLRPDITKQFEKDNINYDHCGFYLKILRQNLPNDYFKIRLEIKSKAITDEVLLKQMIYI